MSENSADPAQKLPPNTLAASQQAPPPADTTTSAAKKKKNKKKKKKKAGAASVISATDTAAQEGESREETPMKDEMDIDHQRDNVDTPVSETAELVIPHDQNAIEIEEVVQSQDNVIQPPVPQLEDATETQPEFTVSHSEPEQNIETSVVVATVPESVASEITEGAEHKIADETDLAADETVIPQSAPSDLDAHTSLEDESSNDSLFANGNGQLPWEQPESATTVPDSQGSNIESLGPNTPLVESKDVIETEPTPAETVSLPIHEIPITQESPAVNEITLVATEPAVEGSLQEVPVAQNLETPAVQESVAQKPLIEEPTQQIITDSIVIPEQVSEAPVKASAIIPQPQSFTQSGPVATPQPTQVESPAPTSSSSLPWETQSSSEHVEQGTIPSGSAAVSSVDQSPLPGTIKQTEPAAPTPAQPQEPGVNPFASALATSLPWESSDPTQTETDATETKPAQQENPFASSIATPLPWESSEPAPQSAKAEDLGSKFANLDLDDDDLLDQESAAVPQSKEKSADKFAFMDFDDDILDDDLLPDEPVVQPEPAATQRKYQPASQPQQVQSQLYQAVQTQFQGQQQFYQQGHQPPPAHHLDVKKLNEEKQKSDAYDFPMDLVPHKPVHKPAKAQSSAQMNQQYQAAQVTSVPSQVHPMGPQGSAQAQSSPALPHVSNPYAPRSQSSTPGVTSQYTRSQGPPVGVYGQPAAAPPPSVIRKKQSSFFEELPLPPIPVKKSRVPSSAASMSPNMSSAKAQQYGLPPARAGMTPPVGPPKSISKPPSRPPSRPPVVAQRQGSISSVTTSPLISSTIPHVAGGPPNPYAPQAGSMPQQSMYAPHQQQQQQQQQQPVHNFGAQYAPPQVPTQQHLQDPQSQSRYAPMGGSTGLGGLAPPPHGHLRKPSIPGQVQPGLIPQSPQPQFSHIIDAKNPYAQVAMSGQAVPLTSAVAGSQPVLHGLPQIQTNGSASYGPPSVESAAKSPSHSSVTPSSTRYAPINHRRQQSSSAAQYDPFSAHKFQQKKAEEEQARLNAPPQHQYGQLNLAPPQPGYGPPHDQYGPPENAMAMAAPPVPQGYAPQAAQGYTPGQSQPHQHLSQPHYPTQQSAYGVPPQQKQYGGMAESIVNPEQLLHRQFPVFSWSNTSKIVSFIPSMQYGVQPGIRVMKIEEVLQDQSLKEFQSVSKKNVASIEKFLDGQFERVSQRHDHSVNDELLLIQLLKHKVSKAPGVFNLGGAINYTETVSGPSFNENFNKPSVPLNKRILVSQISSGETKEALNLALSHQDYPLALLISSIISRESWFTMVENYFNHEFKGDQEHFLPVLFRILSGDHENVIKTLSTDPHKREWALLNWRAIATSVVTNNPTSLPQFLSMFAQFLVENNELVPAYIMLVLADAPVAVFPTCRSVGSTLYLELYGNFLLEESPGLDLSNVFLQHAAFLADYDMLTEAQKYLDTANAAFKASKRIDPVFLYTAKALSARLSGAGVEGGWFARPKLDRVWGTLDKGLNKLISGDEPQSDVKENALFSKFSPAVSRSGSMVSMNFTPGVDLQSQGRGQVSSSPYAPSSIAGTLPPARPYVPASAARSQSVGMGGIGGLQQGYTPPPQSYTPPQFSHKAGSATSSPKPTRSESTTTSPMGKVSRYATSIESGSRRSSIQSHTSGQEELMMRPQPVFGAQNGGPYQQPAPPVNRQLGSPAMTSATPVSQLPQPQVPSTASQISGPPKAAPKPPKTGLPKGTRSGMQSGISLDDLISQERPQQQPAHVPTPPPSAAVAPAPAPAAYIPPVNASQPLVEERPPNSVEQATPAEELSFTNESTLNHSQSTLVKAEVEVEAVLTTEEVLDDETPNQELEAVNGYEREEGDQFDPETPHKGDYFDRTAPSVTQSEMGSTSATPYVVPESVMEEHHIQEDVPEDIQQKIPESNAAIQHSSNPYAPSASVQQASPARPPMKSKVSGRFTPKSYTPTKDLPSVATTPIVSEDVDFYSISGYKPSEPTVSAPPNEHATSAPGPVVSDVVSHQQLPQAKENSANDAYAPRSPVENRSRQASTTSPVNRYAPVQNNFNPYQPHDATENSSRSSSLGTVPHVPSNQESRFTPMSAVSDSSNASSLMSPGVYEPTSTMFNSYEPSRAHAITSIPEGDEKYEDYVEEEDSDEDEGIKKEEPVKEEKKKKSTKSDNLDDHESQGWFGGWFKKDKNGPTIYRAKLGEANNFVYDEKLKRWIDKNASPEELQASVTPPPPPPIIKKKPSSIGKPRSDSMSESGPIMGGPTMGVPSKSGPTMGGAVPTAPPMSGTPSPAPPSASGPPKKTAVSDLDLLLSAGGNSTRRKKKGGRGYVNVMGAMGAEK